MPDEKKFDPFKPQQPSIPGVLPASAKPKPEEAPPELPSPPQEKKPLRAPMLAAAGLGAIIVIGGLVHFSRGSSPKSVPTSANSGVAPAVASAGDANPKGTLPVGPGAVATADELAKPWSSKRFLFRNYVSGQAEPALVVRLPRGDYWGFSLVEPFGNCELEFITNLDKLRAEYHFHADHPMVGDPCNRTVYDLLRYGAGASTDEVVRGMIVQGNGIRPPMAIEIKTNGNEIVAVREE